MARSYNNEKHYIKIKEYLTKKSILLKRELDYSVLNDYDNMSQTLNKAILDIKKIKKFDGNTPIYILTHPEIETIFIYNKKLWDFYYKYNLIDECINNRILKIEFILCDERVIANIGKIINNKKEIMKYLMKNIPFHSYLNTFIKYLNERINIAEDFSNYFITEIMNYNIKYKDNDNSHENIGKDNGSKRKIYKNFYKNFSLNGKDFCAIINDKYKEFSYNKQSFEKIKKLLEDDDDEKDKDKAFNSNLSLNNSNDLELSLVEDDKNSNNENYCEFLELNQPDDNVKNLMNSQELFKEINKEEYYAGIEKLKDIINRDTMINLTSKKKAFK